jgi:tRNA (guanine37-N1)-methyltransferase
MTVQKNNPVQIVIVSLFPEIFTPIFNSSIIGRAQKKGLVTFSYINIREFGLGPHQVVDDKPYGGGVGMVFRADVLAKALDSVQKVDNSKTILMSASGRSYLQKKAQDFSRLDQLIIVCGHYEGVDQRFIDHYIDEEITIGDYVLTGGEIPAMVVADSIIRLIPGVLEKPEATVDESFTDESLLEYPHYTRPEEFNGQKVPDVLLSGNHQKIKDWRTKKAHEKTRTVRPDLKK